MPRLQTRRLGPLRMTGFAIGDYACNLYWQSVSLYLLFYYTDAVGLSAATAGLIYMIASIFDGAIDPLMGALADRTRTRFGTYRPYILFGALPLGLSFALLYDRPPLEGWPLVAVLLAAHLLFRVCYTALSIPYTSLTARLTESSQERSTLAGLRIIFATLAALTVAAVTQPLAARLGQGDAARGYFYTACLLAVVATFVFPIVFAATREPEADRLMAARPSLPDYWRAIRQNRAFLALIGGIVFAVICSTALGKSVLYYYKYALNDAAASRMALSLGAASGLVIVPFWLVLTRYLGKRAAWFAASAWGLAGLGFFAVTRIGDAALMTGFIVYMQVASLGFALTFWSMLPDTVEYGEWCTGIRTESFIFGLGQFFLKVALGLGAGLFGVALDLVGYVPNAVQSDAVLHGMKLIMIGFPAVGIIGGAVAMLFYPLRRGVHETIVAQLAERETLPAAALDPVL